MNDLIGETLLNRYRVDAFVGQGGMAKVYKAWDAKRAAFVAVKLLNEDVAEDYVLLRRFAREGLALKKLEHPNIVRFFGFEETSSLAFLVMEFVEGLTLRRYLRLLRRPLSLGEVLCVVEPICSALHYAHQMRVYHCDVKPANIFIERGGRVVLADFGVARMSESVTTTFSTAGSPAYMSPEQCRGGLIDARTDVYGLGVTTYEMLTLDRPFKGDTEKTTGSRAERVRWEQVHLLPRPPRELNPAVPPEVETVILKALEKDPRRRQQRALAFCRQLSSYGRISAVAQLPEVEGTAAMAQSVQMQAVPQVEPVVPRPVPQARGWGSLPLPLRGVLVAVAAVCIVGLLMLALSDLDSDVDLLLTSAQPAQIASSSPVPTVLSSPAPGHHHVGRWFAYPLDELCGGQPFGNLVFTVESVDILLTGELRFNVSWMWQVTDVERNNCPSGSPVLYSDEGNANMYVTDDLGHRYDHVAVGDGAGKDKLIEPNVAEYGWFLFPPPAEGAGVFAFHDGDAESVVSGIDMRP
jgi:hypothetical protein